MKEANFFHVTLTGDESEPCRECASLSTVAPSFLDAAAAIAKQAGLQLTDDGRKEVSARFAQVMSFGVAGATQRIFVWEEV